MFNQPVSVNDVHSSPISGSQLGSLSAEASKVIDLTSDERIFIETDEHARVLLKKGLCKANQIETLILRTKGFGVEAAGVVAELIGLNRQSLRAVNISDIISGRRNHADAMEVIKIIAKALVDTQIETLDLSDQALSVEGITHFVPVFRKMNLRELKLNNVGLSWEGCDILKNALNVSQLEIFEVHNNMMRNNFGHKQAHPLAEIVANASSLKSIRISTVRLETTDLKVVLRSLEKHAALESLDLSDNFLIDSVSLLISSLRPSANTIKRLILNDCGIEGKGVVELRKAKFLNLQTLELNSCDLKDRDVDALILLMIDTNGGLTNISLMDNQFGTNGIRQIKNFQNYYCKNTI